MRRFFNTLIISLLASYAFGQKITNTNDSTLANQYYEKAISNEVFSKTEAIDLLEKATSLYEKYPTDEKSLIIKGELARFYGKVGRYDEALQLATKTIELGKKAFPNQERIPSLSIAYQALSESEENPRKALEYEYASRNCLKDNLLEYCRLTTTFVTSYFKNQSFVVMGTLTDELITIVEAQEEADQKKYQVFINQCKIFQSLFNRNPEQALIYSEQVINDNKKFKVLDAQEMVSIYRMMSEISSEIAQYEKALGYINKAMELSNLPKEHPEYGIFYTSIANIYRAKGYYNGDSSAFDDAIKYYEKGIPLMLKDSIFHSRTLAIDYYDVSNIFITLGDLDKALKYLKRAKDFYADPSLNYQLGYIYYQKGNFKEGIAETHTALISLCQNFRSDDVNKNPSLYENFVNDDYASIFLHQKGLIQYALGKQNKDIKILKKAVETASLSLKLSNRIWQRNKGFENARFAQNREITTTLTVLMLSYKSIYDLEPTDDNFNNYLKITERLKALQLTETLSPSPLPEAVYEEEQQNIQAIQIAGQQLEIQKMIGNEDSISFYQNQLFEASQTQEKYFKRIQKEYPKVTNSFYDLEYAKLEDIQQQLDENTLFITYTKGKDERFITTISQTDKQITAIPNVDLTEKINRLSELIQDRFAFQTPVRNEFIELSHELYNLLIQPIEKELKGKTRLMLVIEGELFYLPFELLLTSKEQKPYNELDYLIKKYEINYNYSATSFFKLQEKQTVRDKSFFAFAPVFNKGEELNEVTRSLDFMIDSLYRGFDKGEFTSLPSTKKETTSIAKIVKSNGGTTNILLQKKATKTNFNQQIDQQPYQFVHIATHSFVNFKSPKLSAFACYSTNETMANLMYANEIQFKNINADLVVLSSCESGIGQLVAGEGLIALNRSFIYSGAKNVLFSLWKVSDKYSSDLMIDFYKAYFENTANTSYTTALRQAKLKMIANPKSAAPKYWSAFVLMGQ